MGCNASLPMYDITPLLECTDPCFCAYARFLEHEPDIYETAVKIKSTQGERVYKTGSSKVREWFSNEFRDLRTREGISDRQFFQSLVGGESYHLESNSRGSSFFSRSHNLKYILKQIKDPEVAHLKAMAKDLFNHWEKHPNSLLNRIYAAFTISNKRSGSRSFIIVDDAFPHDFSLLKTQYDLKGAKNGNRRRKDWERTKKDLDFHDDFAEHGIKMCSKTSNFFNSTLESDTAFLQKWRCMDYSMLVSVYHEDADIQMDALIDCEDVGRMRFCIIDYLRRFDSAKWREAKIKNAFRRDSSVQNPDYYRDRFLREILFTMCPADPLRESLSDSGHSVANSMLIDGCVVTVHVSSPEDTFLYDFDANLDIHQ